MQPSTSDPLESGDLPERDEVAEVLASLRALAELGDLADGALLAIVERRHGVTTDPKFLPVMRAQY